MDSQIPDQSTINPSIQMVSSSQKNMDHDLFNDPIFSAFNDSFLLGWTVVELRSLIQLIACNITLDSFTFDSSSPGSALCVNVLPVVPGGVANLIDDFLETYALNNVVEYPINSKPSSALSKSINKALSAVSKDTTGLASQLSTLFNNLVKLHINLFPDSTTANTMYDLPPPPQDAQDLSYYPPYHYLYPLDSRFDPANVGISSVKDISSGDNMMAFLVTNFRLYDVTRRALNCLTLLVRTSQKGMESWEMYGFLKAQLMRNFYQEWSEGADLPALETSANQLPHPPEADVKRALKELGGLLVHLLDLWDNFLRENTTTHSDIVQSAYEVGHSLAGLYWDISLITLSLENTLTAEQVAVPTVENVLTHKVQTLWMNVFQEENIHLLQNRISGLSQALDLAYYRHVQPLETEKDELQLHAYLPSRTIRAVKDSLDYWQQAVKFLCTPSADPINSLEGFRKPSGPGLRIASDMQEQGTIRLRWELSNSLRKVLRQQVEIWRSLLLYQQSLLSFKDEGITKRVLNNFQREFEVAVTKTLTKTLADSVDTANKAAEEMNKRRKRNTIIAVVILILLIALVIAFLAPLPPWAKTFLTVFPPAATLALGLFDKIIDFLKKVGISLPDEGKQDTDEKSAAVSPDQRFASVFGLNIADVSSVLTGGRERLQSEFHYLDNALSISQPLVQYFIANFPQIGMHLIKDSYDFLMTIIWHDEDKGEEIASLTHNAFGPLGTFIAAQIQH